MKNKGRTYMHSIQMKNMFIFNWNFSLVVETFHVHNFINLSVLSPNDKAFYNYYSTVSVNLEKEGSYFPLQTISNMRYNKNRYH